MQLNVAILTPDKVIFNATANIIRNAQTYLCHLNICHYDHLETLLQDILTIDVIAIDQQWFHQYVHSIQTILMERSKNVSSLKKMIITSLKPSFDERMVDQWLSALDVKKETITVPIKNGVRYEMLEDILYFEYVDRKVYIKTKSDCYETRLKLREVKELLKHANFISPYVSFIINLLWVECMQSKDIKMKNGDLIPLSQKRAHDFRKTWKDYLSTLP